MIHILCSLRLNKCLGSWEQVSAGFTTVILSVAEVVENHIKDWKAEGDKAVSQNTRDPENTKYGRDLMVSICSKITWVNISVGFHSLPHPAGVYLLFTASALYILINWEKSAFP